MSKIAGFAFGLATWGALAVIPIGHARADEPQAPESVAKCDSIQELEEEYPKSHFTKLDADETAAFLNAAPDPANEMVIFYSVPFPADPSVTVIHGYTIKGCWAGAVQISADKFETIVHGGRI